METIVEVVRQKFALRTSLAVRLTVYTIGVLDEDEIMGKYQQKSVWLVVHVLNIVC